MEKIVNLTKSKTGRILISVIWGFALAAIFKFTCEGRDCIVFTAPNVKELSENIYYHNNECYTFTTETTTCKGDVIS